MSTHAYELAKRATSAAARTVASQVADGMLPMPWAVDEYRAAALAEELARDAWTPGLAPGWVA